MKSCPQCHLLLESVSVDGVDFLVCRGCGGSWHNADSISSILSGKRDTLTRISAEFPGVAASGMYEGLRQTCPECRTQDLVLTSHPDAPDCELLICPTCSGVWLRVSDRSALIRKDEATVPVAIPSDATPEAASVEDPPRAATDESVIAPPLPQVLTTGRVQTPSLAELTEVSAASQSPLERLMAGNRRFVSGNLLHPNQSRDRRAQVRQMQRPFAVIVGCADSRAAPEIIFDQGLGDLFVIRNAGNILTDLALDSIEFIVEELGASLVMVLGHAQCAAVVAAVDGTNRFPSLADLALEMQPAVIEARNEPGDLVENAIKANARILARRLRRFLDQWIRDGRGEVAAAYYDLDSGIVQILPQEATSEPRDEEITIESQVKRDVGTTPDTAETERHRVGLLQQVGATVSQIAKGLTGSGTSIKPDSPDGELDRLVTTNSRWCPQCRRRFDNTKMFCPNCSIGLAEAGYRVRCLKCNRENPIGNDRCWECNADLHAV